MYDLNKTTIWYRGYDIKRREILGGYNVLAGERIVFACNTRKQAEAWIDGRFQHEFSNLMASRSKVSLVDDLTGDDSQFGVGA